VTLLTIVNDAQAVLNLPVTTTIYTNPGETQKQLLRLANMGGRALARRYAWQALTTEQTFTTTATEEQTDATADLPADLGWIVDETIWNRTTTRRVTGPLSSADWQAQKALGAVLADSQYRIRGNSIWMQPAPSASQTCVYEYVSKYWCEKSDGTDQEKWLADTDVARIDEYLLTLDLIWRFKAAKGLDFTMDKSEFEEQVSAAIGRDGTRKRVSVAGRGVRRIGTGYVPEGSWS